MNLINSKLSDMPPDPLIEKLNDTIINVASSVLRKQFLYIGGLQNCLLLPKKCDKTKA